MFDSHLETLEQIAETVDETGKVGPVARSVLADVAREYAALRRKVNQLQAYLLTDKFFSPNDYVNVRDVLNRL